jgi:hypothetical protein
MKRDSRRRVPDPLICKGPGLELTSTASVLSLMNSGTGSSPFTAPNSRLRSKFHHSLLFTLPVRLSHATLPHGRPRPDPNLDARFSSTSSSAPPTTRCPPLTAHSLFPAFSTPLLPITSLQPQQFQAITHSFPQRRAAIPSIFNSFRTLSIATGVYPSIIPDDRLSDFRRVNPFVYKSLVPLCHLFSLLSAFVSFVFNRLQPLFPKHPGWG